MIQIYCKRIKIFPSLKRNIKNSFTSSRIFRLEFLFFYGYSSIVPHFLSLYLSMIVLQLVDFFHLISSRCRAFSGRNRWRGALLPVANRRSALRSIGASSTRSKLGLVVERCSGNSAPGGQGFISCSFLCRQNVSRFFCEIAVVTLYWSRLASIISSMIFVSPLM